MHTERAAGGGPAAAPRGRLHAAGLVLLSTALCLPVFELAGVLLLRRALGAEHALDVDHRMKPEPARGINGDGIRSAREAADFGADSYNLVFLGDSFTFGMFVRAEKAFPMVVEGLLAEASPGPAVKTANFGWVSSSPLLSLRLLRDKGTRYHPDLVVLCLDMTDFHDDLRYERMLEQATRWPSPTQFLLRRSGVDAWLQARLAAHGLRSRSAMPFDRFFACLQPLDRSRPWLAATERYVRELAGYSRHALGAGFLLVMLPRPFQYNAAESPESWERDRYDARSPYARAPFEWLRELSGRVDFPTLSLLPAFLDAASFPTAYHNDPHWNELGHRIAGQAIAREILRLRAAGSLP